MGILLAKTSDILEQWVINPGLRVSKGREPSWHPSQSFWKSSKPQHMLQPVSDELRSYPVTGLGSNSTPLIGGCGIRRVSILQIRIPTSAANYYDTPWRWYCIHLKLNCSLCSRKWNISNSPNIVESNLKIVNLGKLLLFHKMYP